MRVRIRLFAGARDLAGADSITVELPAGATVGELRRRIGEMQPKLVALLVRSGIAVDQEMAADSVVVEEGAEVALLPPVSGG